MDFSGMDRQVDPGQDFFALNLNMQVFYFQ